MPQTHIYITICIQGFGLIINIAMFLMSGCNSEMNTAQWVYLIVLLFAVQAIQSLLAMSALVMNWLREMKASLRQQDFRARLWGFVVCIFTLLALYICLGAMLFVRLDECPGSMSWKPSIEVMALLYIAFCLVCALNLLVGKGLTQAPHPNHQTTVELPDPAKVLAHLMLRTFTLKTTSSDSERLQECAICLSGSYGTGECITELHCHHTFHASCIAGWIAHGGQACPIRCNQLPRTTSKQLFDWMPVESAVSPHQGVPSDLFTDV